MASKEERPARGRANTITEMSALDGVTEVSVPVTWEYGREPEMRVFVQGKQGNAPIITLHDIGLNHRSCFGNFLAHPDAAGLRENCCFYHIDLPGQSDDDVEMPHERRYPHMDEIADWIGTVTKHFKLDYFFAIAVGAGANILTRYLMRKSDADAECRAAMFISPVIATPNWREWGWDKIVRAQIKKDTVIMPPFIVNQNLYHYFGSVAHGSETRGRIEAYKKALTTAPRPGNYAALHKEWTARNDILHELKRKPITVPVLTFYGGNSHRAEQVLAVFSGEGRVFTAPTSSCVEIWKGGDLVHEEDAAEVLDSFKLMLQGFSIIV